jgi:hypothetical protein
MLSVVPLRPDQLDELFDPDGTLRSVRTVSKISEGRKTAKDSLFRNWLRAAFVAQDLGNNADSTSQFQIEPEFPATFTAEQLATFYTDLATGFDKENHKTTRLVPQSRMKSSMSFTHLSYHHRNQR